MTTPCTCRYIHVHVVTDVGCWLVGGSTRRPWVVVETVLQPHVVGQIISPLRNFSENSRDQMWPQQIYLTKRNNMIHNNENVDCIQVAERSVCCFSLDRHGIKRLHLVLKRQTHPTYCRGCTFWLWIIPNLLIRGVVNKFVASHRSNTAT